MLIYFAMFHIAGAGATEPARVEDFVPVCERSVKVRLAIESELGRSCDQIEPQGLTRIEYFEVTLSGDRSLKCGDFSGFMHLIRLTLRGVSKFRHACVFDGLDNLLSLWIVNGSMTSLPDEIFLKLSQLSELRLRWNQISRLSRAHFRSLQSLKELDIESNRLTQVPEDLFADVPLLESLNLAGNDIATIPGKLFYYLPNLKSVFMERNPIAEIPFGLFFPLHNLAHISLGSEYLQYIPDFSFVNQRKLSRLILKGDPPLKLTSKAAFYGLGHHVIGDLPEDFGVDPAGEEWRRE